jgi:hypothetical protein
MRISVEIVLSYMGLKLISAFANGKVYLEAGHVAARGESISWFVSLAKSLNNLNSLIPWFKSLVLPWPAWKFAPVPSDRFSPAYAG